MRASFSAFVFALVLGTAMVLAAPQPSPRVDLEAVLDRAGWYLDYFVDEFENVVAEETYIQDSSQLLPTISPAGGGRGAIAPPPSAAEMLRARHRDLRSDFLLVKSPDTEALVPFRDVIQVDGIMVRDREARLAKLFLTASTDTMLRAEHIPAGAFFAPMTATVMGWFETNRSLAVSLVSAGVGVAPMTISPFARWLIQTYDWRIAMVTIGIAAWVLLIPAALLVRRPPAASGSPTSMAGARTNGMTVAEAFRSPQFIVLALTFTACCAAHSGPIFHMVSYAISCGISGMAAVSIYSVEGLAGLGGRLLLGVAADRIGAKPVLIAGLIVQALAIATYAAVNQLAEFYTLAVIFGTAYGGVMPLYAVIAREYFGQRILGTVLGAATMLSATGMAFGPLIGGWVYDTYNAYTWLYLGSAMVALGAVAIAFAFPPLPSRTREQLQPA